MPDSRIRTVLVTTHRVTHPSHGGGAQGVRVQRSPTSVNMMKKKGPLCSVLFCYWLTGCVWEGKGGALRGVGERRWMIYGRATHKCRGFF